MAKLVDALCSGRSAFTGVLVRIQFWAQKGNVRSVSFLFDTCSGSSGFGDFGTVK